MISFEFDLSQLREGDIVHARTSTVFGRLIRWALNVWAKRQAKRDHVICRHVWGNHDGIILRHDKDDRLEWGVGEALPKHGNTITSLDDICRQVRRGSCSVRVFRPKQAGVQDGRLAAGVWLRDVRGRKYDGAAFVRLTWKALVCDFAESEHWILRQIGSHAAGMRWRNWCTEGVAEAWGILQGPPVFPKVNPTPMTVEQLAGCVYQPTNRPLTLREVTSEVVRECTADAPR
jgi:hypothetical protein